MHRPQAERNQPVSSRVEIHRNLSAHQVYLKICQSWGQGRDALTIACMI